MTTTSHNRQDLAALTGLRFFPALYVVFLHFYVRDWASAGVARDFLDNGRSAVQLFFILSGFILTWVYYAPERGGRIAGKTFWWLRFARIYPLYGVAMLIYAPVIGSHLASVHASPAGVMAHLAFYGTVAATLLQAWVPRLSGAWNAPGWSLSAEAFFYALFPFLLPRLHAMSRRKLLVCLAVLWVLTVVPYVVFTMLPPGVQNGDTAPYIVDCNPLLRLAAFAAGMVLGRLFIELQDRPHAFADAGACVCAAALLLTLTFAGYVTTKTLIFPEMLGLIWCLGRSRGPFARLLGSRPMVLLGNASFAIYILHFPLQRWFVFASSSSSMSMHGRSATLVPLAPPHLASPEQFYLFLAGLVIVSIAAWTCFERPVSRMLRRGLREGRSRRHSTGTPEARRLAVHDGAAT